jgi:hypothetical protein
VAPTIATATPRRYPRVLLELFSLPAAAAPAAAAAEEEASPRERKASAVGGHGWKGEWRRASGRERWRWRSLESGGIASAMPEAASGRRVFYFWRPARER